MAEILQEDRAGVDGGLVMRLLRQRGSHYLSIAAAKPGKADGEPDTVMRFLSLDVDQAVERYNTAIIAINVLAEFKQEGGRQ